MSNDLQLLTAIQPRAVGRGFERQEPAGGELVQPGDVDTEEVCGALPGDPVRVHVVEVQPPSI